MVRWGLPVTNTKKNKAEKQNKNTHALLLSPPSNGNKKYTKQEFYNLVITHDKTTDVIMTIDASQYGYGPKKSTMYNWAKDPLSKAARIARFTPQSEQDIKDIIAPDSDGNEVAAICSNNHFIRNVTPSLTSPSSISDSYTLSTSTTSSAMTQSTSSRSTFTSTFSSSPSNDFLNHAPTQVLPKINENLRVLHLIQLIMKWIFHNSPMTERFQTQLRM
jgi:hypothetical protein